MPSPATTQAMIDAGRSVPVAAAAQAAVTEADADAAYDQDTADLINANKVLVNALRSALVTAGIIKGSA